MTHKLSVSEAAPVSQLPEFRYNPLDDRWVILAPERSKRPQNFSRTSEELEPFDKNCPFCPGWEHLAPVEVLRLGADHAAGWSVRAVANRYPLLRVEGDVNRSPNGPYEVQSGVGAHEVVIETPNHHRPWQDRTAEENFLVLAAWRFRLLDLARDSRLRYFQAFSNIGTCAGATVFHPHSQIVASSVVPLSAMSRLQRNHFYWAKTKRCLCCEVVDFERSQKDRIIIDSEDFSVFCPYASSSPFSILFVPKRHESQFTMAAEHHIKALAGLMSAVLSVYSASTANAGYNLILHTSPPHADAEENDSGNILRWNRTHWYIELISRYITPGGYEFATATAVNDVLPEEAAAHLRALLSRRGN